ncbi:MAG: nitronate monooxygenase, partial [Bacteroidia bacterium]|nr:nitronate monooxygenase [Bacteroidia bacterium]
MFSNNRITQLFNIQYPIVQGGMVWNAGWRLAAAVSNAGGLGLIGAGSMTVELLREHIQKCKAATSKPFGVNLPLLYTHIQKQIEVIIEEKVGIVFTSAGNPKTWTPYLKAQGIKVVHVVPGAKYALKAIEAGCDAVCCEGFEAGGHNGREETTTFTLIPLVRKAIPADFPLIAAGGVATGGSILAALALGADGVQVGTLFAATHESSSHPKFKEAIVASQEGDTILTLKKLVPVRLLKNKFYEQVKYLEDRGASEEELKNLLGKGRARLGMFEGNLEEGELEIGQAAAL